MIKRALVLLLAVMVLSACGGKPAASAPGEASAPVEAPSQPEEAPKSKNSIEGFDDIVKDGAFQFRPAVGASFTMDYEPRAGSLTDTHFGLNFLPPCNSDWIGDTGLDAVFNLYEDGGDVYGSLVINTAPADLAAYYGTDDEERIQAKLESTFFTAKNYYTGYRKNIEEDFGYEIVLDGYGSAFESLGTWNAFYIEFIDSDKLTRSMRFYLCNDEINEKFYSLTIRVDIPQDDTERIERFRSIIFTLHPMESEQ